MIKGLNTLRAIAAVSVVITHLHWLNPLKGTGLYAMFNGGTGVQLFFVLSGFLITRLFVIEHATFGRINIKYFFIRRAFRIIPLYGITLLFVGITSLAIFQLTEWQGFIFACFYSYNFVPTTWYSSVLGHLWSLAVEEHFYLLWPFAVALFWRGNRRKLMRLALVVTVISIISYPIISQIAVIQNNFSVGRWTTSVAYNLMLGCMSAMLLVPTKSSKSAQLALKFAKSPLCLVCFVVLWTHSLFIDLGHGGNVLRGVSFSALISWIYLNQDSILVEILSFRPFDYIGKVSYGIYMYQGIFISSGPNRILGQPWPPDPLMGLMLVFLVVPLSYHSVEKYMMAKGSKYRQRKEAV